jgi:hypothetical protein
MEEVRGRRTWDRRAHDDGQHSDSDDERIMMAILVTRYYSGTASCCGKGYIGSMAAIGGRLNVSHISVGCECTRSASPRPAQPPWHLRLPRWQRPAPPHLLPQGQHAQV